MCPEVKELQERMSGSQLQDTMNYWAVKADHSFGTIEKFNREVRRQAGNLRSIIAKFFTVEETCRLWVRKKNSEEREIGFNNLYTGRRFTFLT